MQWFQRVSVPCRGTAFLNDGKDHKGKYIYRFRPLSGNCISQFDPQHLRRSILHHRFRPLSGNCISQFYQCYSDHYKRIVSVPCRGTAFLNLLLPACNAPLPILFPSPVGELHFSMLILETLMFPHLKFPSPVGELHFSISVCDTLKRAKRVSVPCRGTAFLNRVSFLRTYSPGDCFRPLSGNCISQSHGIPIPICVFSFRPLSGNCISQF